MEPFAWHGRAWLWHHKVDMRRHTFPICLLNLYPCMHHSVYISVNECGHGQR